MLRCNLCGEYVEPVASCGGMDIYRCTGCGRHAFPISDEMAIKVKHWTDRAKESMDAMGLKNSPNTEIHVLGHGAKAVKMHYRPLVQPAKPLEPSVGEYSLAELLNEFEPKVD